jgi:hypothetical protein
MGHNVELLNFRLAVQLLPPLPQALPMGLLNPSLLQRKVHCAKVGIPHFNSDYSVI